MKKLNFLFSLVLMLAFTAGVNAQTSFRDLVKDYVDAAPSAISGSVQLMKAPLAKLNSTLIQGYDEQQSEALIDKYLSSQFRDDMVTYILTPSMEGVVSAEDLTLLTKMLNTPEGKVFQSHQQQMNEKSTSQMEKLAISVVKDIVIGDIPSDVALDKSISKKYRTYYDTFYSKANLDKAISTMMSTMRQTQETAGTSQVLDEFEKYMQRNMKTLYMNYSYGIMTIDDLKFGTKLFSTTAYQNSTKALERIGEKAMTSGMALIQSYMTWLRGQGVKLLY